MLICVLFMIFFYCNTTFLFDHHDHSLKLKEQPVYVTHLLKLD